MTKAWKLAIVSCLATVPAACSKDAAPVRPAATRPAANRRARAASKPAPAASRPAPTAPARPAIGASGRIGCGKNPKRVSRLMITKPGVYENYLIDGNWARRNLVSIKADGVTLRNCTIRNGGHNAMVVYARNVLIDSCRIHHMLAGTFSKQADAHGITGAPTDLVVRNCEVYYVSGDAVQFSPDRRAWDNVLIDRCTFWTGPLPADAAGFKKGERPGENALDTKQKIANPRSRITLRNSLFHGWGDGQISVQAALNVKHHVHVSVVNCILRDNDFCFRLRGPSSGWSADRGGAVVDIADCAVYRSKVAVRFEHNISKAKIRNLAFGDGIVTKYTGKTAPGYENTGERTAPPYERALRYGLTGRGSVPVGGQTRPTAPRQEIRK